ncbi:MAG: hypothetical protein Q9M35_02640 [Rhodothermus sp.]|nr:hypothetical protein [Rhodothermus sp.]
MREGLNERVQRLLTLAQHWREPSFPERQEAVEQALAASDFLTEEAAAFALNQQMHALTEQALRRFVDMLPPASEQTVLLWQADRSPLAGWQEALLLWMSGHRGTLVLTEPAATLVGALLRALQVDTLVVDTEPRLKTRLAQVDVLLVVGDETIHQQVQEALVESGPAPVKSCLLPLRYGVAVLDGHETPDELEGLAEDALLFEGFGCRSVRLIWAPEHLPPDALLETLSLFRSVFPAHPATPGRLKMPRAWLKATSMPHAYGEGLEFLISKGAPEPQTPGHLRWVSYQQLETVKAWLSDCADELSVVVARPVLLEQLPALPGRTEPGRAHRPAFPDTLGTTLEVLRALLT